MRRLLCAAARRQDRLKEFCIMPVYPMDIAGLHRELPICKVTDDLYIGAFICFGDAELTVACARDMLAMLEADSYDYLFTAEAKSIPLIHEMARQSGAKKYFIARKGPKAYMPDPIHVEDKSITTAGVQRLYLGRDDADLIQSHGTVVMVRDLVDPERPTWHDPIALRNAFRTVLRLSRTQPRFARDREVERRAADMVKVRTTE